MTPCRTQLRTPFKGETAEGARGYTILGLARPNFSLLCLFVNVTLEVCLLCPSFKNKGCDCLEGRKGEAGLE